MRKLIGAGFGMKHLSVVGKGYHTDEKVVGFYNLGDRVKFWGSRGAFWGGLWGLFFGGLFMTIPVIGHVVVLGYLAAGALSALEGAVVVGGLGALGAALTSVGIPHDSVLEYKTAIRADNFVVVARGTSFEMSRTQALLATGRPRRLDIYRDVGAQDRRRPEPESASALLREAEQVQSGKSSKVS